MQSNPRQNFKALASVDIRVPVLLLHPALINVSDYLSFVTNRPGPVPQIYAAVEERTFIIFCILYKGINSSFSSASYYYGRCKEGLL